MNVARRANEVSFCAVSLRAEWMTSYVVLCARCQPTSVLTELDKVARVASWPRSQASTNPAHDDALLMILMKPV